MNYFDLDPQAPFYIAGHSGMVGSAIWRALETEGFSNLIGRTRNELDLTDRGAVFDFFSIAKPVNVVLAAAKVGGIVANKDHPVQFLSQNLQIQTNVLDAALEHGVERLVFLGSSCIYPKDAPQPIREDSLLKGPLEATNDAYAIAKIAGIKHIQSVRSQYKKKWVSVMPTNLYGPGDNFDLETSHVIPGMIHRFTRAMVTGADSVTLWGSGRPRREFLHVDDLAQGVLTVFRSYDDDLPINLGTGKDLTIKSLSDLVSQAVGFEGDIFFDRTRPDGVSRKLLDVSKSNGIGWSPTISLESGLAALAQDFYKNSQVETFVASLD